MPDAQRGTGNDQTVKITMFDLGKRFVKGKHMSLGCIFGYMIGRRDQVQFNLERGIAQYAGKLRLRIDFSGHQIEKQDLQRTDILI